VRQWLVKFAAVTGKEAPTALFDIWDEQLRDIAPDKLELACNHVMKTWRYPNLPLPGDVRAQIDEAKKKAFALKAETEWQRVLEGSHWSTPRRFSAATEYSIRAAGGRHFIERCSESELVWRQKTFLETYETIQETGQVEHLLTSDEVNHILRGLIGGPERLPAVAPAELALKNALRKQPPQEVGEPDLPKRDEVRAVLNRIMQPAVHESPTEEEWHARKDRLKRAALEWAAQHGLSAQEQTTAMH
jgi:hypothetical protein